jgi:hypothetical protein
VLQSPAPHPTTAIRLVPLSLISKGSQVPPCAASMATRAIAVTTIQRLEVGIRDQAAGSPKPSVANAPSAAVEPAIGHLNDDRRMRISKAEVATRRARCRRLQLRPASALVGGIFIACPVMDPLSQPPAVGRRTGLAERTQFSTSESCLGVGINRTYRQPKPIKLRRKRMDHRFGKLLLVVSIVDFYLMETARPIWQNEAKNRINIRRPIPAEVVPDAQEFGRLDQQPFRRSQFFWQNEPNSGFGLRADYALILLCATSNLGCRIIAGSAGITHPSGTRHEAHRSRGIVGNRDILKRSGTAIVRLPGISLCCESYSIGRTSLCPDRLMAGASDP